MSEGVKASEAAQKSAHQPVTQQRTGTASLESPQGEQIAQLEAMADANPQVDRLAQLAAAANDNPAAAAQRRLIDDIHNSLHAVAQRQQFDGLAGETIQREEVEEAPQPEAAQREEAPAKPNDTGLPDNLKSGIESLSGISMDNVKVHYNSSQPAQLNAHAYAQGTDIHVAPGQEQHLPHEAWHVVQQAQGSVRPTMQMKDGVSVNDDKSLEHEADAMGAKAVQMELLPNVRPSDDSHEAATVNHSYVSHHSGQALVQTKPFVTKVLQRAVNWDELVEKTSGDHYAVSADHTTLYSKADAAAPQPPGLYVQASDVTTDVPAANLRTWQPNVRFLSGQTIDNGELGRDADDRDVLDILEPQYEAIKGQVLDAMNRVAGEGEASPALGIVGRNDCAQWARALQGMISTAAEALNASEDFDLGSEAESNLEGAPAPLQPGDEMEQQLGPGAGSGHHGATVVASDGTSVVTLEAHVEQELAAPAFHIYEGLPGFVDANNRGPEGDNQFLEANGRRGVVHRVGSAFDRKNGRLNMLDYYSLGLQSEDDDVKLKAIQGALRYYQSVVEAPAVEPPAVEAAEVVPRRGWCFLTTACVQSRGLPDDCEELEVLRTFRDGYMSSLSDGPHLIRTYYEIAPRIVANINKDPRRNHIYEEIYTVVLACVGAIKNKQNAFALTAYKTMVEKLSAQYGA